MKFTAIVKNTFAVLIITLLYLTGLVGHTPAIESMPHDMVDVGHSNDQTRPCDTICRSSATAIQANIVRKKQINKNNFEAEPFYRQFQRLTPVILTVKELLFAAKTKPPPNGPSFLLHSALID